MDQIDLLKSHVDAYTKKDGTTVNAHDTKVQKHAARLSKLADGESVHYQNSVFKGEKFAVTRKGDKYHLESKTPFGNEKPEGHAHAEMAERLARLDGGPGFGAKESIDEVPAPEKAAAPAAPAAKTAPPISTHAAALAASSQPGDLDHWDNQIAAGYMAKGDHKGLASHIKNLDTAARDHILDHVHPDHREGLGFQQINMDRSQKQYAEKFPDKKPVPKGRGFPKQHTAESAKADSDKARAAMQKLKDEN